MKSIFILIITCFTISSNNMDKTLNEDFKDCSAELKVKKNQNSKAARNEKGVTFFIELVNTSSKRTTYKLSAKKVKGDCDDNSSNKKSSNNNIDLDVTFNSNNSKGSSNAKHSPKNEITLNAGESYNFLVNLKFPKNTPYSICRSVEILAKSKDCESSSAQTILNVYNPSPSDK